MHEILDVLVEKGMEDGEEIIFPRKGEQPNDVYIKPGDLIFTINTQPHPVFTRFVARSAFPR